MSRWTRDLSSIQFLGFQSVPLGVSSVVPGQRRKSDPETCHLQVLPGYHGLSGDCVNRALQTQHNKILQAAMAFRVNPPGEWIPRFPLLTLLCLLCDRSCCLPCGHRPSSMEQRVTKVEASAGWLTGQERKESESLEKGTC